MVISEQDAARIAGVLSNLYSKKNTGTLTPPEQKEFENLKNIALNNPNVEERVASLGYDITGQRGGGNVWEQRYEQYQQQVYEQEGVREAPREIGTGKIITEFGTGKTTEIITTPTMIKTTTTQPAITILPRYQTYTVLRVEKGKEDFTPKLVEGIRGVPESLSEYYKIMRRKYKIKTVGDILKERIDEKRPEEEFEERLNRQAAGIGGAEKFVKDLVTPSTYVEAGLRVATGMGMPTSTYAQRLMEKETPELRTIAERYKEQKIQEIVKPLKETPYEKELSKWKPPELLEQKTLSEGAAYIAGYIGAAYVTAKVEAKAYQKLSELYKDITTQIKVRKGEFVKSEALIKDTGIDVDIQPEKQFKIKEKTITTGKVTGTIEQKYVQPFGIKHAPTPRVKFETPFISIKQKGVAEFYTYPSTQYDLNTARFTELGITYTQPRATIYTGLVGRPRVTTGYGTAEMFKLSDILSNIKYSLGIGETKLGRTEYLTAIEYTGKTRAGEIGIRTFDTFTEASAYNVPAKYYRGISYTETGKTPLRATVIGKPETIKFRGAVEGIPKDILETIPKERIKAMITAKEVSTISSSSISGIGRGPTSIDIKPVEVSILPVPILLTTTRGEEITEEYNLEQPAIKYEPITTEETKTEPSKKIRGRIEVTTTTTKKITREKPILKSITTETEITKEETKVTTTPITKPIVIEEEKQLPKEETRTEPTTTTKPPIVPTSIITRIPPSQTKLGSSLLPILPKKKLQKGEFLVELKQKGTYKAVGKTKELGSALRLGSTAARGVLSRTFKITPSESTIFKKVSGFRSPIRKGKETALKGIYIQKKGIETKREVRLIQASKKSKKKSIWR